MQLEVQSLVDDLAIKKPKTHLITIEGIDGCGKSTQIQKLAKYLQSNRIPHHITCEPTKNEIGQLLRQYLKQHTLPLIDALLFAADRLDHCQRDILPALIAQKIVVSDRYVLSSIAYQSLQCYEFGASIDWIATVNQFCIAPDLVILLDIDPNIALQRRYAETATQNREKFEEIEFQSRLRKRYLELVNQQFNDWKYIVIDASTDQETVFNAIIKAMYEFLPKK